MAQLSKYPSAAVIAVIRSTTPEPTCRVPSNMSHLIILSSYLSFPGAHVCRAARGMIPDANPQSIFGRGGNELLWESIQDHAPVTAEVADQVSAFSV